MYSLWHKKLWLLAVVVLAAASAMFPAAAQNTDDVPRIIFMHHSTGQGVIWGGDVREDFVALGYAFWDHGYNEEGLIDPQGAYLGVNWDVPGDNTDPDGWHAIFQQPVTDPPANTFSHMLQYDVIIFKSCFPSSHITGEGMLEQYKRYFLDMRAVMDQHPDKLFIPFTTPPLVPNETDAESAARAQRWAAYLTSDEYLSGHPNIVVFDFFTLLADENGYLRAEYRSDEWDSHPNDIANRVAGPELVAFVDQAFRAFVPGDAPAPVESAGQAAPAETESPGGAGSGAFSLDLILPPEMVVQGIWDYTSDPVNAFACQPSDAGYEDDSALMIAFDIPAEGAAGCGYDLLPQPEWATTQGISFFVRADTPDLVLRVALGVRDPAQSAQENSAAAPFEQELRIPDQWTEVFVPWEELTKAAWFGEQGVDVFDPAQVVWLAFDVGYWESAQVGTLWIDSVTLVEAAP